MIIKDKFKLINNVDNITNIPKNTMGANQREENSPRHVFTFLMLKRNSIKHFAKDTIFKFISDKRSREQLEVVNLEQYPLSATFNRPTRGMVFNLKPFDVEEVANLSPNDLYAGILYTYTFHKLVTGRVKIPDLYAKSIINFLTSMFVRVFGKEYGLTETYAGSIPKLKFLLSCYIHAAFFGYKTNEELLRKATSVAPFMYKEMKDQLLKYDFSDITQFLKALSEMKVMPGIKIYSFTAKIFRFFKIDMLAALEDLSRFLSTIMASSVTGSTMVPSFISKYNEKEYKNIIELTRKVLR